MRITKQIAKQHSSNEAARHTLRRGETFRFMKRLKRLPRKPMTLGVLVSLGLVTAGCVAKEPLRVELTDNTQYEVATLFTHHGCTLYRFKDYGERIYFASCPGIVSQFHTEAYPCGEKNKSTCYRTEEDHVVTYVERQ